MAGAGALAALLVAAAGATLGLLPTLYAASTAAAWFMV
jgi:hypothetical protein